MTICALNVDLRVSLPTRWSIRNSWNKSGDSLKAAKNGDASSDSMRSQKPEGSRRSGLALWFSKPTRDAYVLSAWQTVFTLRPLGVPAGPFLSRKAANFKRGFADGVGASFRNGDLSGLGELAKLDVSPLRRD